MSDILTGMIAIAIKKKKKRKLKEKKVLSIGYKEVS